MESYKLIGHAEECAKILERAIKYSERAKKTYLNDCDFYAVAVLDKDRLRFMMALEQMNQILRD